MKSITFPVLAIFISGIIISCSGVKDDHLPSVKNLIIYEIAPRAYTSPDGPESGTFKSTMEKLPYLKSLGINSIWLTGHNWADNSHFYGIWTQYATIRPDFIEPALGTPADFKLLVKTAHQNGIRIFLDVITHGVMNNSPLIKEHPDWFKGGSWGMTDYDWNGGHKDLDDWWVKTWTGYALRYDVDGFRLDVDIYRPDLWKQIKQVCAQADHPVIVFDESLNPFNKDAFDFYQHYVSPSFSGANPGIDTTCLLTTDVAKYFSGDTGRQEFYYSVQLSCHDNGWAGFPAGQNPYVADGSRYLFGYAFLFTPAIPIFMAGEEFNADYRPLPRLTPDLYGKKSPGDSSRWLYGSWLQWNQLKDPDKIAMFRDVQHMIFIRNHERDIIHAYKPGDNNKRILPVATDPDYNKIPVPFMMWSGKRALLIAANPFTEKDIDVTLNIPLVQAGLNQDKFKVTDIWNNGKTVLMAKDELTKFRITISKDKQPGGGVAVYKIEGI